MCCGVDMFGVDWRGNRLSCNGRTRNIGKLRIPVMENW